MEAIKFHTGSRRILSFALVGILFGSILGGILWNFGGVYFYKGSDLLTFKSEQEIIDFLRATVQNAPSSLINRLFSSLQPSQTTSPVTPFAFTEDQMKASISGLGDYSTTTIQVAGVDEADIVKTDGEYIYLVSGSTVYIVQAYPVEEARVVSKISLSSAVSGLFVNDEKLVVFQNGYGSDTIHKAITPLYSYYYQSSNTTILTYNIADKSNAVLERSMTVDGSYFSSRMIGNYVYVVITKPAYFLDNYTASIPTIRLNNVDTRFAASSIQYTGLQDYSYSFTIIVTLNIQDVNQKPSVETLLLGATSQIYVSTESIYLTSPIYATQYSYSTIGTTIHKISVDGGIIAHVASGNVSGYVLNQYSMDEYNGMFRLATTNGTTTNVYDLDENLKIIGRLEGLGSGESLHSARFMGNRCYLVTFKKVDPFFVVSLDDPRNPKVLGQLKIPGYSDYLQPYDESHIIGVGKETVEAESGSFAWYQGVKIALFDVSNVTQPKEVAKYIIGDRGTDTPVLRDPKAFLFSGSKHLLALPILLARIDPTEYSQDVPSLAYGEYVWQGEYVFNITVDSGFQLKGSITHLGDNANLKYAYYLNSPYFVKRALYIGDVIYTISDSMVKMNSLEELIEVGVVLLN